MKNKRKNNIFSITYIYNFNMYIYQNIFYHLCCKIVKVVKFHISSHRTSSKCYNMLVGVVGRGLEGVERFASESKYTRSKVETKE